MKAMGDLLQERRNGVLVLTLNRPEVRNALSPSLRRALGEALDQAASDASLRAVVLTGAGTAFCAGLDLAELQVIGRRTIEENRADATALADLFLRLYRLPKPVIAAVNGHAVAGGAGLASLCDLVILSERAKIGYSEAKIGFVAALVGVFLVRQLGERRARELLLSARLLSAQEALALGLVNEVVPAEAVLDTALLRARELSDNAPASLALTKALLADVPGMGLAEALRYAVEINTAARLSEDLKEGVAAFLAKRPPRWQGK